MNPNTKFNGIRTGGMILFSILIVLAVCAIAWDTIKPYVISNQLQVAIPLNSLVFSHPLVDPESLFNESLIPPAKPTVPTINRNIQLFTEPKNPVHLNYPPLPNPSTPPP